MQPKTRDRILRSPFLPVLVFPHRLRLVVVASLRNLRISLRWLVRSREFANFTYDLTELNKDQLSWFVSNVTHADVRRVRELIEELESNERLRTYIQDQIRETRRSRELDRTPFYGRRVGWYAMLRIVQPSVVIETGTEKGLGSLVIAEALRMNGKGHLYTIDIEESSGILIGPEYSDLVTKIHKDSVQAIQTISDVDFFIHDSDHSPEHERAEFEQVQPVLTPNAIVVSDNSHATSMLSEFSEAHGREFHYFAEKPVGHWYPGAGIGVAVANG